jgi:hypothetical protein
VAGCGPGREDLHGTRKTRPRIHAEGQGGGGDPHPGFPGQGQFGKQVQVRRFDCSFIFTDPVQTSVGELDADRCLDSDWGWNCLIVLATL